MGLDALNELVALSQVDDLAEMMDQVLRIDADVNQAFALLHRLRDSRPMQRSLSVLQADPEAKALIRSRAVMPPLDPDQLLRLPKGSLGQVFGTLIRALDYNPDFYASPEYFNNLETDADYVNYRTLATHDLHHVLTGFNFDPSGELGVISVSVAQYGAPGLAFISWVTVLATWMGAKTFYTQIDSESELINSPRYKLGLIEQGMAIGDSARPLFALDWPALLSRDLEELRRELGVVPVREGPASWMSRPELMAALA
ncbi:MAG: Coq4 family protein [Synechococcus sp.]|nr:Coq4 family protein [Synechococcus sp.]